MIAMNYFSRIVSTLLILAAGFSAVAQPEIGIDKTSLAPGNEKPVPVNLSGFTGEALEVIQFDLYVQGFTFTGADSAQYLLSGSNNGNLTARASDRFNKSSLVSKTYTGVPLRKQAHVFVDDFLQAINRKGLGGNRIAFKADKGASGEIYMADFDGANRKPITSDGAIVAAPAWIPNRLAMYYTSYRLGNPDIFLHDFTAGTRTRVAGYSGLNTSAAPSPDGRKVAMIISKGGSPDVYVADTDGKNLVRLTKTREDESSPCWSPNGQWICFATKINERRCLAKVPASGGSVQRVSTSGVSNPSEPDWSPDGKWIVFTSQMGGFDVCVVPAEGGSATVLVSGEDPSWGPNSRTVIFARRSGAARALSLLDVPTKQVKTVSRISGSNSQPSWAR